MNLDIHIPTPQWGSPLTSTILELEKLQTLRLAGSLPSHIFFQLKDIFQTLETLGSARIEGNNTTLAEYVEQRIERQETVDEKQQELGNIERAIHFIEENTDESTVIDAAYLSHLHTMLTHELTPPPKGEGSRYPGLLRPHEVTIARAGHRLVAPVKLKDAFEVFTDFINEEHLKQNQLLMIALAHHRFMYIHPFDNGNGRMGRLLTYALLIKFGFNVGQNRIINPSSVFYADRDQYYKMLGQADSLEDEDLLAWSIYFLDGLKNQIDKIDNLVNRNFTVNTILQPSLKFALERKHITDQEYDILNFIIKSPDMTIKSEDLDRLGITNTRKKTYVMSKLRDKKMVQPLKKGGRIYTINFMNSYLLRSVIKTLDDNGFIAEFLNFNR